MAELRAEDVTPIPEGYVPLGPEAFAERIGLKRRAGYYRVERLAATQHDPEVLRVVRLPVATGKGARRLALHVLWPVAA